MNKFKTEICKKWLKDGNCPYKETCQFAHGFEELREKKVPKSYKTVLCENYSKNGNCRYGERCKFVHDTAVINESKKGKIRKNKKYKTKICKFYSENGECPFGENCGFIHKPLVKKEVIEFDNIKYYVPIIKRASSEEFDNHSRLHKWTKRLN